VDRFDTASLIEGCGASCQDRVGIFRRDGVIVGVVADGAGGTAGGAEAASLVIHHVGRALDDGRNLLNALTWKQVLLEAGTKLEVDGIGQTTGVVIATDGRRVLGASVGDSGAWLVGPDDVLNLSEGQPRKPLLGDRLVEPKTIWAELRHGDSLLLATDGVLKYASADQISATIRRPGCSPGACCAALVQLVRLPGGALQDDVGVVLVRSGRGVLEAGVASSARAWQEALAAAGTGKAPSGAERAFAEQLEQWIASLLPAEPRWQGRWYDGLIIDAHSVTVDQVDVRGRIWAIERQIEYPFEARLTLDACGVRGFEVLFGGDSPSPGIERPWTFRFRGPPTTRF
jgi:PPM family protein phosphatase